jgi:translation initiation factor IF-3
VKIVVQFKGREMQHKELGRELLLRIHKPVEDITIMEAPPKEEGKAIAMMLGPKKLQ